MGQNNIEWLSGKWYNVFGKWCIVCRKCIVVFFVTIICINRFQNAAKKIRKI